jgi:putative nucleotidyltransferase with HDIG domain
MKIESTFLHSKLARRIFWLFVLSALIPMTVLAVVSLRNVTAQLMEQSRRQLHEVSRDEAMTIYGRLSFLEAEMELVASSLRDSSSRSPATYFVGPNGLSSNLASQFKGMELLTPDGNRKTIFGQSEPRIDFTAKEQEILQLGKNVLSTIECNQPEPCIVLSRQLNAGHPAEGILAAEIRASNLWDVEKLHQDTDLCVLDPSGRILFCSGESPSTFPAQVSRLFSGEFEWELHGQKYLADYWNLPLDNSFSVTHWTIVSSEAKADVLAPLARFRTSFLLVFLLALWVVLLLSLIQIRRNLVPLAKLKEGTRGISLGDFRTRVEVSSEDEFGELAESFNSMASRIEKQLSSLKVINEIDRAILSAWEMEKIVGVISDRLGELIPHDLVSVSLFEARGSLTALTYTHGRGPNSQRQTENVVVTAEELSELTVNGGISILNGSSDLPSYLKPLIAQGMGYFLRVPILLEGRPSAVFTLGHASSAIWNEEDKEHARQLADQVAVAQANSQLVLELQQLHWGTMTALARAIDAKSPWTLGHSERVTDCAIKIAEAMGLPPKELDIIRRGGLLHDIGKIGTPAEILDKPGKLTAEELKEMREHVNIGARILEPIPGLADSMPIVLQHHEWVNGGGYPKGLAGEEISLHARIFAVADCFDALASDRPYRAGMPMKRIMQILWDGAGKQFDPRVLEVFQTMMEPEIGRKEREEASAVVVEVNSVPD